MDPSAWIELVLSRAADIRAAGVLELEADGCAVRFAPLPPPPPAPSKSTPPVDAEAPTDPLHARETYGAGDVPGFDIEPLTEEF